MICVVTKYYSGDQIEKNEMGGACRIYGERRGVHLRERAHLRGLGVNGRIILKWIFKKWDEGTMDYIAMSQYRDMWRSFVDGIMNFLVP